VGDPPELGARAEPIVFARTGALRYFDPAGAFIEGLTAIMGGPAPGPLQAVRHSAPGASRAGVILLWRSPSETLMLCDSVSLFEDIERFAEPRTDGCLVEQTGGLWCCAVSGPRAPDLIVRLGSIHDLPRPGQALTGRLADVTVTVASLDPGDFMLLSDRVHAAHLTSWMRATLDDF